MTEQTTRQITAQSGEPILDLPTAVRELGALPMPAGSEPQMPPEQRAAIAELIGDAKPATGHLLLEMAQQIRDRREHDHSTATDWDWYCLNASGWLGDKAPTVLRRLLNAEARVAELKADREANDREYEAATARIAELEKANEGLDDLRVRALDKNTELRDKFEAQLARANTLDRLLRTAQARVAELEAAPRTVYRASHDSIPMGLYTTAAEARKHCETEMRRDTSASLELDWIEDSEGDVAELVVVCSEGGRWTGYTVTALEIAAEYDPEADQ